MAKDRLLFLISFALLGLFAAVLFRHSDTPLPTTTVPVVDQLLSKSEQASPALALAPGKMAIPYQLNTRPAIAQFMHPGQYVDVIFTSKADMGFGTVTLTLLKNIRVLDIGHDSEGKQSYKEAGFNRSNSPLEILLEMTPREAEVFSYAAVDGIISFAISETPTPDAEHHEHKEAREVGLSDDDEDYDYNYDDYYGWDLSEFNHSQKHHRDQEPHEELAEADEEHEHHEKHPLEPHEELAQQLLNSSSDENFNSILVTHMVHSLFPKANVKVTVTPRGYIIEGKVPDQETAHTIVKILGTLSSDGSKTVINLMEEHTKWSEVLVAQENIPSNESLTPRNYSWKKLNADNVTPSLILRTPESEKWVREVATIKSIPKGELIALNDVRWPGEAGRGHKEENPEIPMLPPEPGMRVVLFMMPGGPMLSQELEPGSFVDVMFATRGDVGVDVGNLPLLSQIRILGLRDASGRASKEMPGELQPAGVLLEMTPRQAEIFSYAQAAGIVFLQLSGEAPRVPVFLTRQLLRSTSAAAFRSILITHLIRTFFPRFDVCVTAGSRGYVIQGTVPDPQIAEKMIEIFAKFVPGGDRDLVNLLRIKPQQVRISVKVYEVERSALLKLGINWELLVNAASGTIAFGATYPRPLPTDANFFFDAENLKFGSWTFNSVVDMLEEDGHAKILAEPNLTTVSGATAHFFSGGEFPVLIPQGGTLLGTVTVEYKKYGVLLDFTPVVELNGLITMHVVPEVSNLDKENSVVIQGFIIPALLSRRVDTIVKLWPGQTYIIGGMYLDERTRKDDNLYGLNKLPVVGPLFDSFRDEERQQELVIIVTPYLYNDEEDDWLEFEDTCEYGLEEVSFED